jgi:hypothetical protein
VEERLAKPENQTAEILKRLAIGLAVASFFIVILRYTTGLYRMNYGQELKTMYDDDATRRFYVGYKSSADNEEQRKVVLTAFMAATAPTGTSSMSDTTSATSEEMGLLKEIVATLAKKL